jgi:hypothetical protein
MAPPLSNENRNRILEYLKAQDFLDLSNREIAELIEENTGIHVSQPTASRLKRKAEDLQDEELANEILIKEPSMNFNKLRDSCRDFINNEGLELLYEMARNGSSREKLDALKLLMHYGYGRPNNKPDVLPSNLAFF